MFVSDKEINILTQLGLSLSQARVYLALARHGPASANLISDKSTVARPDVYRILSVLQTMGLVEKALTIPALFKATPVNEALPVLLKLRTNELRQLKVTAKEFLKTFEGYKNVSLQEDQQFVLFPANQAFINRSTELADNSFKIIETVMPIGRILQAREFYKNTIAKARNRGVVVRLISEDLDDEASLAQVKQIYSETKFIHSQLTVGFTIYDRQQVLIVNAPRSSFPKSGGLWSNNASVVELAKNYYDNMWNSVAK